MFSWISPNTMTNLWRKRSKGSRGGRGVHAVIVTNAANKAYEQALNFLKPQGTLVCIGMPEGTPVPIQSAFPAFITMNQFRIIGTVPLDLLELSDTSIDMDRLGYWKPQRSH